ncbi:DDE_3 domain-containing protein [Trichonephila clavipes]|nr:DDE_3 domain-containing protein [Trichonephila clavipes]
MQERDQRRLTRIIKRDRRPTLSQIAADFNAVPSKRVTLYASPRPLNIDIGLLITGNTLPGLKSFVSNGIELTVWRQLHESMDPTYQHGTVQAGGGSVMFRHFRWPPNSPEMNITEYIWDALQRAVQKRSPPPLTPTDLWTALQDS